MSNADALRRLAEEVIDAHEDRVVLRASILNDIDQIKSETRECQKETVILLRTFTGQHLEMGKELRSELGQFMSDLNESESIRLSKAREDADRRQAEISRRNAEVDQLRNNTVDEIRQMADAHQEMGKQLRADLDQFMSGVDAAESGRLSIAREDAGQRQDEINHRVAVVDDLKNSLVDKLRQMADAHQEMGKRLRADLDQFMSGLSQTESIRKAAAQAYLSEIHADIRETAAAWKALIQRIQAARAAAPSAAAKTAETAASFPPGEKKNTIVKEAIAASGALVENEVHAPDEGVGLDREHLGEKIVAILREHADGIKMTQLAELLGIENWRSLIPVMRELMDDRTVEKDGSLYFA